MAIDIQQSTLVYLSLDQIASKLSVRRLSARGVKRLVESMEWAGFLANYPLVVVQLDDGTYLLIDGNHRYEAAKALGIEVVPCIVKVGLDEAELYRLAFQSNAATESAIPSTFVTYAEFIRNRLAELNEQGKSKYTQAEIGKMLGWSRESVKDYAALQKICSEAWEIIGATFEQIAPGNDQSAAPSNGAIAPFTEGLLRDILLLTFEQQLELVRDLAEKKIEKGKFTSLAKAYRVRNAIKDYALEHVKILGEPYLSQLVTLINEGSYDNEWQSDKEHKYHPKLDKLLQDLRDEWERKSGYRLLEGDCFSEEIKKQISDGSVDLILTDPPYNIARDNVFDLEGRSNISQDFGAWDKYDPKDFIKLFARWAGEWVRVLRDQGSGYVFTSDRYISDLRKALEAAGLHVKATLIWHKSNPGTQVVKTNFKSSVEYILFFTKGQGGHTFNWLGDEGHIMHNFIEGSICIGNERLKDARGETLHPTQKPKYLIEHLMKISSNRGDVVYDGFMGVGTTGEVAVLSRRKFIGIELNKTFYKAAERRVADVK